MTMNNARTIRHFALGFSLCVLAHAQAARPVTVQVMVDQTMFASTPGSQQLVHDTVIQIAAKLIPNLDTLRIGMICGQPQTVFEAKVARDLRPVEQALKSQVLKSCSSKGSPLNAGLVWGLTQPGGAMVLLTDSGFVDDPSAARIPATVKRLTAPLVAIGAQSGSRDAFDRFLHSAPNYLGTFGNGPDAQEGVSRLMRALRR